MDARIAAASMERSIAGQVEFWARIGKAVESVATGRQMAMLQETGQLPLAEIVATVNQTEGRARLKAYLESRPFPRFTPHPELEGTFVREDQDGTRTVGRFQRGIFEPTIRKRRVVA